MAEVLPGIDSIRASVIERAESALFTLCRKQFDPYYILKKDLSIFKVILEIEPVSIVRQKFVVEREEIDCNNLTESFKIPPPPDTRAEQEYHGGIKGAIGGGLGFILSKMVCVDGSVNGTKKSIEDVKQAERDPLPPGAILRIQYGQMTTCYDVLLSIQADFAIAIRPRWISSKCTYILAQEVLNALSEDVTITGTMASCVIQVKTTTPHNKRTADPVTASFT